ncbi:MAG TPA: alternative oxidase [Candidatus Paceibacterota bacterium]|nr:alternative oxidase [Candidatus Paceibacterota bacterium]
MDLVRGNTDLEALNQQLNDPQLLAEYKRPYDDYQTAALPRLLGHFLVWAGNLVYGEEPSYLKFRAVEVIARVPYHSWASAAYTLLTLYYRDEKRAMALANVSKYSRIAQDNETMHVVVISHFAAQEGRAGYFRHTFVPMFFAFFYFWWGYFLYLINPRYSYELNYMFENHAFEQYNRFLAERGEELKRKPAESEFLTWYGRNPRNQYEFFLSVRNDEIIHRNTSIREIDA